MVLIVVLALALVGCNQQKEEVVAYLDHAEAAMEEWEDAFDLAANTSRIALSPAIGELQSIRREFDSVDVPEDCKGLHRDTLNAMNASIDGFMLFMADEPESEISAAFNLSEQNLRLAMEKLDDLHEEFGVSQDEPAAADKGK